MSAELQQAVCLLASENVGLRDMAIRRLLNAGPPSLPYLAPLLHDPARHVLAGRLIAKIQAGHTAPAPAPRPAARPASVEPRPVPPLVRRVFLTIDDEGRISAADYALALQVFPDPEYPGRVTPGGVAVALAKHVEADTYRQVGEGVFDASQQAAIQRYVDGAADDALADALFGDEPDVGPAELFETLVCDHGASAWVRRAAGRALVAHPAGTERLLQWWGTRKSRGDWSEEGLEYWRAVPLEGEADPPLGPPPTPGPNDTPRDVFIFATEALGHVADGRLAVRTFETLSFALKCQEGDPTLPGSLAVTLARALVTLLARHGGTLPAGGISGMAKGLMWLGERWAPVDVRTHTAFVLALPLAESSLSAEALLHALDTKVLAPEQQALTTTACKTILRAAGNLTNPDALATFLMGTRKEDAPKGLLHWLTAVEHPLGQEGMPEREDAFAFLSRIRLQDLTDPEAPEPEPLWEALAAAVGPRIMELPTLESAPARDVLVLTANAPELGPHLHPFMFDDPHSKIPLALAGAFEDARRAGDEKALILAIRAARVAPGGIVASELRSAMEWLDEHGKSYAGLRAGREVLIAHVEADPPPLNAVAYLDMVDPWLRWIEDHPGSGSYLPPIAEQLLTALSRCHDDVVRAEAQRYLAQRLPNDPDLVRARFEAESPAEEQLLAVELFLHGRLKRMTTPNAASDPSAQKAADCLGFDLSEQTQPVTAELRDLSQAWSPKRPPGLEDTRLACIRWRDLGLLGAAPPSGRHEHLKPKVSEVMRERLRTWSLEAADGVVHGERIERAQWLLHYHFPPPGTRWPWAEPAPQEDARGLALEVWREASCRVLAVQRRLAEAREHLFDKGLERHLGEFDPELHRLVMVEAPRLVDEFWSSGLHEDLIGETAESEPVSTTRAEAAAARCRRIADRLVTIARELPTRDQVRGDYRAWLVREATRMANTWLAAERAGEAEPPLIADLGPVLERLYTTPRHRTPEGKPAPGSALAEVADVYLPGTYFARTFVRDRLAEVLLEKGLELADDALDARWARLGERKVRESKLTEAVLGYLKETVPTARKARERSDGANEEGGADYFARRLQSRYADELEELIEEQTAALRYKLKQQSVALLKRLSDWSIKELFPTYVESSRRRRGKKALSPGGDEYDQVRSDRWRWDLDLRHARPETEGTTGRRQVFRISTYPNAVCTLFIEIQQGNYLSVEHALSSGRFEDTFKRHFAHASASFTRGTDGQLRRTDPAKPQGKPFALEHAMKVTARLAELDALTPLVGMTRVGSDTVRQGYVVARGFDAKGRKTVVFRTKGTWEDELLLEGDVKSLEPVEDGPPSLTDEYRQLTLDLGHYFRNEDQLHRPFTYMHSHGASGAAFMLGLDLLGPRGPLTPDAIDQRRVSSDRSSEPRIKRAEERAEKELDQFEKRKRLFASGPYAADWAAWNDATDPEDEWFNLSDATCELWTNPMFVGLLLLELAIDALLIALLSVLTMGAGGVAYGAVVAGKWGLRAAKITLKVTRFLRNVKRFRGGRIALAILKGLARAGLDLVIQLNVEVYKDWCAGKEPKPFSLKDFLYTAGRDYGLSVVSSGLFRGASWIKASRGGSPLRQGTRYHAFTELAVSNVYALAIEPCVIETLYSLKWVDQAPRRLSESDALRAFLGSAMSGLAQKAIGGFASAWTKRRLDKAVRDQLDLDGLQKDIAETAKTVQDCHRDSRVELCQLRQDVSQTAEALRKAKETRGRHDDLIDGHYREYQKSLEGDATGETGANVPVRENQYQKTVRDLRRQVADLDAEIAALTERLAEQKKKRDAKQEEVDAELLKGVEDIAAKLKKKAGELETIVTGGGLSSLAKRGALELLAAMNHHDHDTKIAADLADAVQTYTFEFDLVSGQWTYQRRWRDLLEESFTSQDPVDRFVELFTPPAGAEARQRRKERRVPGRKGDHAVVRDETGRVPVELWLSPRGEAADVPVIHPRPRALDQAKAWGLKGAKDLLAHGVSGVSDLRKIGVRTADDLVALGLDSPAQLSAVGLTGVYEVLYLIQGDRSGLDKLGLEGAKPHDSLTK